MKLKENIEKRIYNNIIENNLILSGDRIVVAVSGGPDSMTLLNSLVNIIQDYKINAYICIAHVNHKIRKESEDEKIYVENYAKQHNLDFFYLEKEVEKEAEKLKLGTEEYGRKIRYEFFYDILKKNSCNKIAIAHNENDNAETILLNLLRGCALKGLCGMEFKTGEIIRPMLNIKKEEVLKYCDELNINPCIDKTNFMPIYKRNKVRLELIPMLEEKYNPNIIESINRMGALNRLDEEFLEKYTDKLVSSMIISKDENSAKFNYFALLNEEKGIKYRCIREIINSCIGNVTGIESKHIKDILKMLETNLGNKRYIIGNKFEIKVIHKNLAEIRKKKE